MNKRLISVLTIVLLAMVASTTTTTQRTAAADAIVQQTCAPYENGSNNNQGAIVLSMNGELPFELQNVNTNNPSATDCTYTFSSGAYGWNFTTPYSSNSPNYPAQIDVRMYGTEIAGLTTAEIDTSGITANMPSGNYPWDLAWDVYLYDDGGTLTDEMMIWMLWSGFSCSGSGCNVAYPARSTYDFGTLLPATYSLGSFSDGYNTYTLYEYQPGPGSVDQSYHQFRINSQQIPARINLLAFIQYLQKLGRTPAFIGSVDLGSEVWQGSGSVQVNSYSLQLGAASSITTYEGPAPPASSSTVSLITTPSSTGTTSSSTTSSTSSSTTSSSSSAVTTSSSTHTTTSSMTTSSTSSVATTSSSTQTTSSTTSLTTTTAPKVPSISFNPSSGPAGSTVDVSGSSFSSSDSACSISGNVVSSPVCSVSAGILTGTFAVANVASGSYSVTVTGTQAGDSASASFTVPPPSINFSPTSAQIGATVNVTGSYFSKGDTTCSLSGIPVGTSTCSLSSGTLSASFNVTSITPSTYTITATGSPSDDSASATFVVKSASIVFNPSSAQAGSNITVSGSGFLLSDASCTLSGSPVANQSCAVSRGTLSGSFTVANLTTNGAPVAYTVTARGNPAGDSASANLIITSVARMITLNPSSARVGSTVQVDASGFSLDDSKCLLSGDAIASGTCSMSDGSITGSFTVANVTVGGYTVTVTGSPVGDSVTADFSVTSPSIALSPKSGPAGTTVQVSGSGFLPSDSSCTLSGSAVSFPSCSISIGTLSGSFTVTNVTTGSYVVTAIGNPNDDAISATFSVTVPLSTQTTTSSTSSTVASPDFSLTSPTNVSVAEGGSGSATVTVRSINGFGGTVVLSLSWIGTAPLGVNLLIVSPITLMANGTGTTTLTIFASPTASVGVFTIQVEGTSGSLMHVSSPNISVQILQAVSIETSTSSIATLSSMTTRSTNTVTTSMITSVPNIPPNCPVSTATSGSALAPLAQGLRVFRDESIMKTRTGLAFMTLFNAWYYSFSPPLASHLGTHRTQRVVFGYALYPLIGLLYASYYTYILISPVNNEIAAVTAGLVAAAMIGFVYLALPLYITKRVLRRKITTHSRLNQKYLLALSAASSLAMGFSYSAGLGLALGFAASSLLLSFLTLGVIAGNFALEHVRLRYVAQQLALLNDVCKTLTIHTITYVHRQASGPET